MSPMLAVLLVVLIAAARCMPTFPSIGFVGRGYNLLTGNPHGRLFDPGFQGSVFDVGNYSLGTSTADRRYALPNGVDAVPSLSCSSSFTSLEITSVRAFVDAVEVDVHAEVGNVGVPFSASAEFHRVTQRTRQSASVFVESTVRCEMYKAHLHRYTPPQMTSDFSTAVDALADDDDAYHRLFREFGTHVATEVTFGSRTCVLYEMTRESYKSMLAKRVDVRLGASILSQAIVGAGARAGTDESHAFESVVTSKDVFSVGSLTNNDTPLPIRYTLVPVTTFIEDPGRRRAAEHALHRFCSRVPGAQCELDANADPPEDQQAPCPPVTYSGDWVPMTSTWPCTFNGADTWTVAECTGDDQAALAGLRLTRPVTSETRALVSIGCVQVDDASGVGQWSVPVQQDDVEQRVACPASHVMSGMKFTRPCLAAPATVMVSVRCRRMASGTGACATTEWVRSTIPTLPTWAEASCPAGRVVRALEFRQAAGGGRRRPEMRLECCSVQRRCSNAS